MLKLTVIVVLLCLYLVQVHGDTSTARPRRRHRPFAPERFGQWSGALCANASLAEAYLTQTRELISQLRANGSFDDALAKRTKTIAYLESDDNKQLLSTDCKQFFKGLFDVLKDEMIQEGGPVPNQNALGSMFWRIICNLTKRCNRRRAP